MSAAHVQSEVVCVNTSPFLCLLQGSRPKYYPADMGTGINVPGETKWQDRKRGCSKCSVVISMCCNMFYMFIGRSIALTEGLYILRARGLMGSYHLVR